MRKIQREREKKVHEQKLDYEVTGCNFLLFLDFTGTSHNILTSFCIAFGTKYGKYMIY